MCLCMKRTKFSFCFPLLSIWDFYPLSKSTGISGPLGIKKTFTIPFNASKQILLQTKEKPKVGNNLVVCVCVFLTQ